MLYIDCSSEAALIKFAWRHRFARVALVSDNAKLLRQETQIDRLKHLLDGYLRYETDEVFANMKRPTETEQVLMMLAAESDQERRCIERLTLRDNAFRQTSSQRTLV